MRRIPLSAALGLLVAVTIAPQVGHATGNVLLPSASPNSDSGALSLPSLGLSVPTPPPVDSSLLPPEPPPPPKPAPKAQAPVAPTPTAMPPSQGSAAGAPPTNVQDTIAPFTEDEVKRLPPGTIPTRVLHQPDMSATMAQAGRNLPYSLTIGFSDKSFFGAKDVETINKKLGLSRDQVSSSCYLSVGGLLQTDKGSQMIAPGLSPQATVRYDGRIKNYLITSQALCLAGNNLPSGSGFLTEIGNRFVIPLQPITCSAPNSQVTGLTITYNGSGTSQCTYQ